MLTLFSIPKPFRGHIGVIQNNAIRSWILLKPQCEIILFGNEEGTAEIAAELGVKHVPEVECNEYGTPLLNSMFDKAQELASYDFLCRVNCDLILLSDLTKAVKSILRMFEQKSFLMIGGHWNIELDQRWDFAHPAWEDQLRAYGAKMRRQHTPGGIDYFVFPRGLFRDLPPFAIGRFVYVNWILQSLLSQGVPVIDAKYCVTAFHQDHTFGHQAAVAGHRAGEVSTAAPKAAYDFLKQSPEVKRNIELAGGVNPFFSPREATWVLTRDGELKRPPLLGRLYHRAYTYRLPLLPARVHPFRMPLRVLALALRAARSLRAKPRLPFG